MPAPINGSFAPCFTALDVHELNHSVSGRLVDASALKFANEINATAAVEDPLYLSSFPGFAYWNGYQDGWYPTDLRSGYAVLAETESDAIAAVQAAAKHDLRLVVKSTGHDFLARSSAPGSLMLNTHKLRSAEWHDKLGICGETVEQAVSLGAGAQLYDIYLDAQSRGRFFLGGKCATVGHAGFALGGGYGFLSNYYGTGATNILQARVILADGRIVTATPCNKYRDLLRALRGGGGGTFGVATEITYRTFPYPQHFGEISLAEDSPATSSKDNSTSLAVDEFLTHLRDVVIPLGKYQHIGGNIIIGLYGAVKLTMNFVDISEGECNSLFAGVFRNLKVKCTEFTEMMYPEPGSKSSPYGPNGSWYPPVEAPRAGSLLSHILNRQIDSGLLEGDGPGMFGDWAQGLVSSVEAHNENDFSFLIILLHFGFAHSSETALKHVNDTSIHPAIRNSYALAMWERMVDLPYGEKLPVEQASAYSRDAEVVTTKFRELFPDDAPAQLNINGYHERNFQEIYWGMETYNFLTETKRKYDPNGLFWCHTCVDSDSWTDDGNCRALSGAVQV